MLKPPSANMPGMTDTLEFVKNLWGSMNLPGTNMPGMAGMAAPPMSVEDLDKRIADLKAVESWLNMHLAMLRGTIQTMEVQRATLSTLNAMGSSMAEAMRQSGASADAAMPMAFAWWNTLQEQFRQAVANATSVADPARPSAGAGADADASTGTDAGADTEAGPRPRAPRGRVDKP